MKKDKNKEYITKMEKAHPNKFNYANTQYINSRTNVSFSCKEHGEVITTKPGVPLIDRVYYGCSKCKNKYGISGGRLSVDSVKKEFIKVHGDKYDYSLFTEYKTTHDNIKIICPEHGVFVQTAKTHKEGHGCKKCSGLASYTQTEYVKKANKVHGNKYTYLSTYKKAHGKLDIECPEHGIFKQLAYMHLQGQGCPECGVKNNMGGKKNRLSDIEVIKQFNKVHFGKYNYSKMVYKTSKDKILIGCPSHGTFEQKPNSHKLGYGCPSCSTYGFNTQKPAILYYLKINGGEAYKIGITNRSIQDRFSPADLLKIDVIKTWVYDVGQDARDEEQNILKEYKSSLYRGDPILKDGNTEIFSHDVLLLDL